MQELQALLLQAKETEWHPRVKISVETAHVPSPRIREIKPQVSIALQFGRNLQ
jgi:hypothetical protein